MRTRTVAQLLVLLATLVGASSCYHIDRDYHRWRDRQRERYDDRRDYRDWRDDRRHREWHDDD